jgi:hypothetical protein
MITIHSLRWLSRFALAIVVCTQLVSSQCTSGQSVASETTGAGLIGTWVLVTGSPGSSPPGEGIRLRLMTGTHWSITQPDKKGLVIFHLGGTYSLKGNELTQTKTFGLSNTGEGMGRSAKWNLQLDGDTLKLDSADGVWHEIWKRLK